MKRMVLLGSLALFCFQSSASAALITASAELSWMPDGSNFDYTITVTNASTSDASIGTFWYAWVPGADFLATSPLSVAVPTGWADQITHFPNVPTNGYAIQWTTGATDSPANIAPGASLQFMFTSADSPAALSSDSIFYPGTPVGTSFVYPGAPFSDAGHEFVVATVPEPSSAILLLIAVPVSMLGARRLRSSTPNRV
jgi:hypothetical protein